MDLILDYEGKYRYASLTRFDWQELPADDSWWRKWIFPDYQLVTQSFVDSLKKRIDTQKLRSTGYTPEMLERLGKAERLLKELTDENADCGAGTPSDSAESKLPEGVEGQDGTEA